VHTLGPAVTIGLPIFDRNQGMIALERAARQTLADEYVNRVFAARSDIATALATTRALTGQIAAAGAAIPVLEHLVTTSQTAVNQGNVDMFSYDAAQNNLSQKEIAILKQRSKLKFAANQELAQAQKAAATASSPPGPTACASCPRLIRRNCLRRPDVPLSSPGAGSLRPRIPSVQLEPHRCEAKASEDLPA
jgi:Outer membrane efflux protein